MQIINAQYCDVDLQACVGNDARTAINYVLNEFIELPYKINHTTPQIKIAYSTEQWTWGTIKQYGGMDPADPRVLQTSNTKPIAASGGISNSEPVEFTTVDLSAYA